MINNINESIWFGQFKGLSILEIYQGTLNINQDFLRNYLDSILNSNLKRTDLFPYLELIDRFEVNYYKIRILGEIGDPEEPISALNRVSFGNIQSNFRQYLSYYFSDNFLGILQNTRTFNKNNYSLPLKIGAAPEYLEWCEREINGFEISNKCKKELERFSVARFLGIDLLYIGNETYEYSPEFSIEKYEFKNV